MTQKLKKTPTVSESLSPEVIAELETLAARPHECSWIPPETVIWKSDLKINKWFDYKDYPPVLPEAFHRPTFKLPKLSDIKSEGLHISVPTYNKIIPTIDANATLLSDAETLNSLGKSINTNFRAQYGKNLPWTRKKVARDIMQNFMDGHNGTIEGVKFDVVHNPKTDRYKVKIWGQGEYSHKEIEDIGAGTKAQDKTKAGGFGEGAKMASIKMLSDYDTSYVNFACRDWSLKFNIAEQEGTGIEYLYRTLNKTDDMLGNFIELETGDKDLVKAILNSTDYVYHPGNSDFHSPLFENEHFGLKYLGEGKSGNLYVANQRFEYAYSDNWDNPISRFNLYFKRKPSDGIINTGRDRTSLSSSDIESLIKDDFAKTMSDEELTDVILKLKDVWNSSIYSDEGKIFSAFIAVANNRRLGFKFPEQLKYIANNEPSQAGLKENLTKDGYTFFNSSLGTVGMPKFSDLIKKLNVFTPILPDAEKIRKIGILDAATEVIVKDFNNNNAKFAGEQIFRLKELDQPVYFYDRKAQEGYKDALATAITDIAENGEKLYAGQWMDINHINESFSSALSTRLHEMAHKYGGDKTDTFSYALTSIIEELNKIYVQDGVAAKKLLHLEKLWNTPPSA